MKFSIALLTSVLLAAPAWADLTVTITGPPSFNDTDEFKFTTTITNTGSEDVTVLNDPYSPVSPKFATNIFGVVSDDGTPAKFQGIALKWDQASAVAAKDFTVVKAGESIKIEQDYSGIYDFSESGESSYKIDGGDYFQVVSSSGEVSTYVATVTGHTAKVAGKLASSKAPGASTGETSVLVKRAYAHGCTPDRIKLLSSTLPNVRAYVTGAINYLSRLNRGNPRWTTWFGVWNAGRKATVYKHFLLMNGDGSSPSLTYDCSTCPGTPNRNAYAYVYPTQPTRIYLCAAFWRAPITGTDSKAGTIVHELSHFNVNGGTRDYAYGQTNARALARSKPATAIMNADSHEYFAENVPHLG